MNLYEEAGLSRTATAEEIRHAYHNIVRLLHPDSLQDPKLQAVAEAQLRRINAVFEVLNDPKRRAEYDRTLDIGMQRDVALVPNWPVGRTKSSTGFIKSIAAGLAVVGLMLWVMVTPESPPPLRQQLEKATEGLEPRLNSSPSIPATEARESDVAEEIRKLRRELREVRGALPSARETDGEDHSQPPEPHDMNSIALAQPVSSMAPIRAPAPVAAPPSLSGSPAGVIGTWLYAQRRGEVTKKDWYPPDFIELRVQPSGNRASDGAVTGRFQARYRVGDRLISPEVRFRFEGKGEVFPWSGPNGARGEVRLTQVTPLTLQVDWTTTHPGDVPSLTSGSSLLVKSPE